MKLSVNFAMNFSMKPSMTPSMYRSRQQGVTLVELVISIVIMSVAMVGVLSAFGFGVSRSADPLWQNKSLKLAQLYLDEILAKPYDDNTPVGGLPEVAAPSCAALGRESGETARINFDDVDDYNGTDDSPPVSLVGALDASYTAYRVTVTVTCDSANVVSASGVNHAKKILVTVTPPEQAAMSFAAYKGNF